MANFYGRVEKEKKSGKLGIVVPNPALASRGTPPTSLQISPPLPLPATAPQTLPLGLAGSAPNRAPRHE